ncbi:hypothetical protein [Paraflavitalea speifideaquila]|uniref:hypothetical protein n=1 Tax=Paraflavitalea speifideaquila TaxID=3076558 RepID=UPI0028EAB24F|nr:hypothetical protein [Paraflavitalea speifideiaquila]
MTRLAGIKRVNELDILCQHWEVGSTEGATSAELLENARGGHVVPGLDIFTDSSYVASPRGDFAAGHWRIKQEGKERVLVLTTDKQERAWHINELNSGSLRLTANNETGTTLYLNLSSDGMIHRNRLNDPFHPLNNQWRLTPEQPETDSAIANRAKQCVKFYALFYRDNILRQKTKINFAGLPDIFEWYSGGIGMPDWEDIHGSWLRCFYDSTQARKGYDVLRKVIVDYEFDWPKGLPDWRMRTENVLEQMYHKMK